jgi:hypothetical protein
MPLILAFTRPLPTDQVGTVPSGPLGGRVSGVSFVIADADRVPSAPNKAITVSFTTATPLASGNVAIITFPDSFIVSGTSPVFDPTNKFSSVSYAAGTPPATTGSLTLGLTSDLAQGTFTVVMYVSQLDDALFLVSRHTI